MNELALFAGAGGGILAGQMLGWRTVCAVERDAYAAAVLAQRQNDGLLDLFPIWSDVETFDGRPWQGIVDVVSGGFPCQDISAAGSGAGIEGERSGLWREMARIVREVRPRLVFVENSPILTSRGLGVVLGDLASMGFDAEWGVLGASDVGAPHQRDRIWIVAYAERAERRQERGACNRLAGSDGIPQRSEGSGGAGVCCEDVAHTDEIGRTGRAGLQRSPRRAKPENCCSNVPDTDRMWESQQEGREQEVRGWSCDLCCKISDPNGNDAQGLESRPQPGQHRRPDRLQNREGSERGGTDWITEPNVGRVAHGVASRVDRLKALGNGQVPQCAAEAVRRLMARFAG